MKAVRLLVILFILFSLSSCNYSVRLNNSSEKMLSTSGSEDSLFFAIATTEKNMELRKSAISKMTFGPSLAAIVRTEKDPELRKLAVSKITFQPTLTQIAKTDKDPEVRKLAVEKMTFGPSLSEIFRTEKDPEIKRLALSKTSFHSALSEIITTDKDSEGRINDLGELWIVNYEIKRLQDIGRNDLAKKVDYFTKKNGEQSDFDISSFDENGNKIFINVKTTKGSINSSFFITSNELEKSKVEMDQYFLYRLYNFDENNNSAELKIIKGDLTHLCNSPTEYEINLN